MHTHDIFSIPQIQVTAPHLATKNISTFFSVAYNSDFFFYCRKVLRFASFVNTEYMALLNFDLFLGGLSNFSFLLYFLQFVQKHSECSLVR